MKIISAMVRLVMIVFPVAGSNSISIAMPRASKKSCLMRQGAGEWSRSPVKDRGEELFEFDDSKAAGAQLFNELLVRTAGEMKCGKNFVRRYVIVKRTGVDKV